ncbi:MAG: hypothetical protein KDJ50_04155 [Alphaproteobacteria bacterium]|nr:hypothetical protein [Alphaproteobacteria bacterium]
MKKGLKVFGVMALLVVVAGSWWNYQYPSGSWRYKITVEVETPEGIKTGSAIREVIYQSTPHILPEAHRSRVQVKGEAVVIELGEGKYLFALMDTNGPYRIVSELFPYNWETQRDYIAYYKSLTGEKKTLDQKLYPTFVTFKDINDQMSVTPVDRHDLSQAFGTGVKLKNITVEMTDEPVTWQIDELLPWLQSLKSNLDGSYVTTGSSLANTLHVGYFKRGQ